MRTEPGSASSELVETSDQSLAASHDAYHSAANPYASASAALPLATAWKRATAFSLDSAQNLAFSPPAQRGIRRRMKSSDAVINALALAITGAGAISRVGGASHDRAISPHR